MTGRKASSNLDKVKQTQAMHCFAGRGPSVWTPGHWETEPEPLNSEKEVAMEPEWSCAQDSACS
jgi:hypothetical protein